MFREVLRAVVCILWSVFLVLFVPSSAWSVATAQHSGSVSSSRYWLSGSPDEITVTGTAASSQYSTDYRSDYAFDDPSLATVWIAQNSPTGWLRANLSGPAVLSQYRIRQRDEFPNDNPKTWTVSVGDSATGPWTVVDSREDQTWNTTGENRLYTVPSWGQAYSGSFVRFNFSQNNGGGNVAVRSISMTLAAPTPPPPTPTATATTTVTATPTATATTTVTATPAPATAGTEGDPVIVREQNESNAVELLFYALASCCLGILGVAALKG